MIEEMNFYLSKKIFNYCIYMFEFLIKGVDIVFIYNYMYTKKC